MAVEVSLNLAFEVIGLDVFVVLHEDELLAYKAAVGQEMIFFFE